MRPIIHPAIRFYCGVSDASWNRHAVHPGPYVCVSPVYGRKKRRTSSVKLPRDCHVIQDSGAFSDNWTSRLTFAQALHRQEAHAERYGYADQIEARATYDLLIDEVWG